LSRGELARIVREKLEIALVGLDHQQMLPFS
jgi:hypothetical protein